MCRNVLVAGMFFLMLCLIDVPSLGSVAVDHSMMPSGCSMRSEIVDLPTWYQGDTWTYKIDPLSFTSPNASFSGSIQNLKEQVVGIVGEAYSVSLTGTITGTLTVSGISGSVAGDITGSSLMRVSDLAEETSEIDSQGILLYQYIPFPYELNLVTTSEPALEVFDFPLGVGETWELGAMNIMSGFFSITGIYEQPLNGSQWVEETVSCTGVESVSVPAGTFECFLISRGQTSTWYSSEAGNIVKSMIDESGENFSVQMTQNLQSYSRASQPLTVTELLDPWVAAPGASVEVSGVVTNTATGAPIQNGTVTVTIPSTGGSWSTTTDTTGHYSLFIIAPDMLDDTPSSLPRETGSGGIMVSCSGGGLSGYRVQTLTTVTDTAPRAPEIGGSTEGKVNTPIPYGFTFFDPEDDNLSYYINWGDGTNTSWVGPGDIDNLVIDHIYTKRGAYTITAQTKDVYGLESPVGTLQVTMPVDVSSPFFHWFFEHFPHAFPLLRYLLGW
jgi:hypothetical protein